MRKWGEIKRGKLVNLPFPFLLALQNPEIRGKRRGALNGTYYWLRGQHLPCLVHLGLASLVISNPWYFSPENIGGVILY